MKEEIENLNSTVRLTFRVEELQNSVSYHDSNNTKLLKEIEGLRKDIINLHELIDDRIKY